MSGDRQKQMLELTEYLFYSNDLNCFVRSNKVLGVTGPMSRKATFKKSGVFMGNATFKSNTNLHFKVNFLTNQRLNHYVLIIRIMKLWEK